MSWVTMNQSFSVSDQPKELDEMSSKVLSTLQSGVITIDASGRQRDACVFLDEDFGE